MLRVLLLKSSRPNGDSAARLLDVCPPRPTTTRRFIIATLLVLFTLSLCCGFALERHSNASTTRTVAAVQSSEIRTVWSTTSAFAYGVQAWDHYQIYLLGALAFIIIQSLLVISLLAELSRRRRAELALSQSEFRMRELAERAPYGITRAGWKENRFLSANPAAVKMLGYLSEAELCSRSLSGEIYVDSSERQKFLDVLRPYGEYSGIELRWKRKDGTPITVRASGRVVANPAVSGDYVIEGMIEDVTEQALLQQEFRQAQKMEAVGRLAGGVAHDFNNLLGVILGYGELLGHDLPSDSEAHERVRHIMHAARHAATLTSQLLTFSRRQVVKPRVLKLNSVVSEAEKLLRRLIGEDVELRIKLDPDVGRIKADHGQLVQVIMNLAVNARDAMPDGGMLTIATSVLKAEPGTANDGTSRQAQCIAVLKVSDTGTGIPPDVRAHIFEPFFTTKGVDEGTGLGLATAHGIVTQNGGRIEVDSEVGKGTTFEIYLPCVEEDVQQKEVVVTSKTGHIGGSETLLIVEDSPQLRELMSECLRDLGYSLLTAGNGAEAVDLLRTYSGPIHLMITDVVMPHMSGTELYQRVQKIRPGMKVVFISGYLEDTLSRLKAENAEITLIEKPFQVSDFTKTIREILDSVNEAGRRAS